MNNRMIIIFLVMTLHMVAYGQGYDTLSKDTGQEAGFKGEITFDSECFHESNPDNGYAFRYRLYGMIDALSITRHGNQLKSVTDTSGQSLTYTGSSDFVDGSSEADEYSYNENGSLQENQNRGITSYT